MNQLWNFKLCLLLPQVKETIDIVKKIAKANKSGDFEFAADEKEQAALWSARKEALWSMLAMKEDDGQSVWSTDVAVPFSRLPDLIGKLRELKLSALVGAVH